MTEGVVKSQEGLTQYWAAFSGKWQRATEMVRLRFA
jgi:hypothetical protein